MAHSTPSESRSPVREDHALAAGRADVYARTRDRRTPPPRPGTPRLRNCVERCSLDRDAASDVAGDGDQQPRRSPRAPPTSSWSRGMDGPRRPIAVVANSETSANRWFRVNATRRRCRSRADEHRGRPRRPPARGRRKNAWCPRSRSAPPGARCTAFDPRPRPANPIGGCRVGRVGPRAAAEQAALSRHHQR